MPGFSAMKRFEQVLDDGALDAVGVPHDAHVAGVDGAAVASRAAARMVSLSFMVFLPWQSCRVRSACPAMVQAAGSRVRPSAVTWPSGVELDHTVVGIVNDDAAVGVLA